MTVEPSTASLLRRVERAARARVPRRTKAALLEVQRRGMTTASGVASGSSLLSGAFAVSTISGFRLEARRSLAARKRHWSMDGRAARLGRLRRCVHRLEKGLVLHPRRLPFGRAYVVDAVQLADAEWPLLDEPTKAWIDGVLAAYVEAHVSAGHEVPEEVAAFVASRRAEGDATTALEEARLATLSADDVASLTAACGQLLGLRQSIRAYTGEVVPADLLADAVGDASRAPSSCNRDMTRVVCVQSPPVLEVARRLPWGTAGYADDIAQMLFIVGDLAAYEGPHDRHAIYVDGALFAMSLSLSLTARGIASCFANWPDRPGPTAAAAALLGLSPTEAIVTTMSIGYVQPGAMVPRSTRCPHESRLTFL